MKENTVVASLHGYASRFREVFDSSEGRDPLTFLVGHGKMIPGFEEEMMGAILGERREFTLEAARHTASEMKTLSCKFLALRLTNSLRARVQHWRSV